MGNTLTVRLPEDLADWLKRAARAQGRPAGQIVREQLQKARADAEAQPFRALLGTVAGPSDLSMRKGFSRR